MLWRFRREIIFIIFLLVGVWFTRHHLTFTSSFFKKKIQEKVIQPDIENIISENERFRKLLNLKQEKIFSKVIYASVKTISPWVFPSTIVIDKGYADGVKENMAIISSNNSLIGRIVSVDRDTATGITLYHQDSRVSVLVSSTGELAVIEGVSISSLYPYLKIKFLPPECRANAGDVVETSGFTKLFPSHIRVGKIIKIDSSTAEPVKHGIVLPFFINENFTAVALVE
jgi:rod shape-determining protein MreC